MKKSLLIIVLLHHTLSYGIGGITYMDDQMWGGRLGDKLMMLVKAKWVSFASGLPLYIKPFAYSHFFAFNDLEQPYNADLKRRLHPHTLLQNIDTSLDKAIEREGLNEVHYYFSLPGWGNTQKAFDSQEIMNWNGAISNKEFLKEVQKILQPKKPVQTVPLPLNKISIAIHIRKGGGYDIPLLSHQLYDRNSINKNEYFPTDIKYADRYWPLKFVPDQYYIDQLQYIADQFQDKELYVFIFTDDAEPHNLCTRYSEHIKHPHIQFDCRRTKNSHSLNLIEDLFSMAQFDCLIRGGSNFPQISQLIGSHRLVIYPKSARWIGKTLVVDDVGIWRPHD